VNNQENDPLSSEDEASDWSNEIFERAQERVENPEEISDSPDSSEAEGALNEENEKIYPEETLLETTNVVIEEDFDFELPGPFRSNLRKIIEWVAVIGTAFIVAFVIKVFLFQAYYIPSPSMEPTLGIGDRVIVNKLSYDLHDVNRGDLIVFENPSTSNGEISDLIKRVVALPGETLEVLDGKVYIDGNLMIEPYLEASDNTFNFSAPAGCIGAKGVLNKCVVPDGHVFVMGDNRDNSRDSRIFGPVDIETIVGRAFVRVWPLGDFQRL